LIDTAKSIVSINFLKIKSGFFASSFESENILIAFLMAILGLRVKIFAAISSTGLTYYGKFETFYKMFISKLLQLFEII